MKILKIKLLDEIERGVQCVKMHFKDNSWTDPLPSAPGWYFLETNAPIVTLMKAGLPKGVAHYNIPSKVEKALSLKQFDACILPSKTKFYFVYSGEAKNLKARAREHYAGHSKTGCLALINYPPLHKYQWRFHYSPCKFGETPNDSKLIRIFGEQIWRSKYGWPVLCGK